MAPCAPLTGTDFAQLNPGIRRTVVLLRTLGYDTFDSGDRVNHLDHDTPYSYVMVRSTPERMVEESKRLLGDLERVMAPASLPADVLITAVYNTRDDEAVVDVMGFSDADLPTEGS